MAQVFDTELEATSLPVVDVQVPEQALEQAPLQDPPSKKLWKALTAKENGELYTKSYDEFVKQYSTPESISSLHSKLISPEFGELYTKGLEDFNNQYFPELKKKEEPVTEIPSVDLSELGTSGSQDGASKSTTPTNTETPTQAPIDASGRITFEQKEPYQPKVAAPNEPAPANTIDLILQANDNLNRKIGKIKDQAGRERDIDQPDLQAQTEGKRTLDYLKTFKIDTDDLYNKIKDLPPEIYNTTRSNQDGTIDYPYSKEKLFEMYQNEPAKFTFTVNHLKNMADITKSAEGATIDGQPVDKSYFGKLYNSLNVGANLQDWEQKKGQQIELINKYLPSLDAKKVALDRLETNASMYYTPANPDVMAEYNASPLKDKLDPAQFAALQIQKMFNPKAYEQSIGFLNVNPKTKYEVTSGGLTLDNDGGLVMNQPKEIETEESIKTKVGKETTLKNLADAGRYNTIMNLQYKNEKIASQLKAFPTDQYSQLIDKYNAGADELKKLTAQNEELKNSINENLGKYKTPYIQQYNANIQKANSISQEMNSISEQFKQMPQDNRGKLIAQFNDNLAKINAVKADYKKDAERYPNYFDIKYEQQVKDFMQQSGFNAVEYGIMKFGMGLAKTGRSLENVGISLFGNNEDKIIHDLASYGESQVEAQDEYLPSKYQMGNNLVSIKVNDDLQAKLDAVIRGRDLSDLSTGEKDVLKNILAQNQDQVHTITDTEKEGKGANFFSLATLYANTGMLGDIMSFAVQGGGLAALGVRGVLASAIPMWTTTQDDFRKEGIAKGLTGSELDGYANLNASIMFLAGTVTPQLDVLKRMVGTQTATGKMLAGITEDTWNSVINKNRPIIDRIKNSVLHTTEEAAKMTGTFGIGAPALQQIVGKEMYNDRVSYTDIKNNIMESGEHLLKSSVALLGIGAITNLKSTSPEQKAALWQLGANPKMRLAEIDDAVKNGEITSTQAEARKKVINDASKIIQNMPTKNMQGKPLTDKQRVDYFYNLLIQDKVKSEKNSLPTQQVKKIEYAAMVSDHLNNLIVDPQDETQLNGRIKELNKILKTDENDIDAKAELDAINIHLENLAQEKKPTKTPEEILTGKPVTLLPLEIGGFKVISEETPVGGERVFKVIDDNGVERFLTADGKELLVAKATAEFPTKPTAQEIIELNQVHKNLANQYSKRYSELLKEGLRGDELKNHPDIVEIQSQMKKIEDYFEQYRTELPTETTTTEVAQETEIPQATETTTEVTAPTLEDGATIELPPQVKGALPRKMIFKDGIWQEQVGSQITGVSEKVQQQAQAEWETKNPVTEQPVVTKTAPTKTQTVIIEDIQNNPQEVSQKLSGKKIKIGNSRFSVNEVDGPFKFDNESDNPYGNLKDNISEYYIISDKNDPYLSGQVFINEKGELESVFKLDGNQRVEILPEGYRKEGQKTFTVEDLRKNPKALEADPDYGTLGYPDSFVSLSTNMRLLESEGFPDAKVGDVVKVGGKDYIIDSLEKGRKDTKVHLLRIDEKGNILREQDLSKKEQAENKAIEEEPTEGEVTGEEVTAEEPTGQDINKVYKNRDAVPVGTRIYMEGYGTGTVAEMSDFVKSGTKDGIMINWDNPTEIGQKSSLVTMKDMFLLPKESKEAELPQQKGVGVEAKPTKPVEPKTTAERKTVADRLRQAKLGKGKTFDATIGLPVAIWDGAVELVAKSIEAGIATAEAINRGLNYIQKNHRGKWDKKAYNDKVIEALGYKGMNINGEDVITKPMTDKKSAEVINGFYSPLEQGILDAKGEKFTGKEWAKKLDGVTEGDEMQFTGMSDFLSENANKSLTKQEVLDYMKNNRIEINEIVKKEEEKLNLSENEPLRVAVYNNIDDNISKGDYPDEIEESIQNHLDTWYNNPSEENFNTLSNALGEVSLSIYEFIDESSEGSYGNEGIKYESYQLPGEKTNYREVLITLPKKEAPGILTIMPSFDTLDYAKNTYGIKSREYLNIKSIIEDKLENKLSAKDIKSIFDDYESTKNDFKSSHFDEPNILAHIRMNTRIDAEGNKVTHIEEFQSDWGQQGRKIGFTSEQFISKEKADDIENRIYSLQDEYYDKNIPLKEGQGRQDALYEYAVKKGIVTEKEIEQFIAYDDKEYKENTKVKVPYAPFVTGTKNWAKLAWKVALKEAVKEGADKITWTTGEQQNERYDLSKQVNKIVIQKQNDGRYRVAAWKESPTAISDQIVNENQIEGIVGKEIANKAINEGQQEFKGNDLKVGGSGMKGFYGSPKEGKIGIVGEVIKSMTGQEPKTTKLGTGDHYDADIVNGDYEVKKLKYEGQDEYEITTKNGKKYLFDSLDQIQEWIDTRVASTQHSIDITPEIKEGVKEGLPLFKSTFQKFADTLRSLKSNRNQAYESILGIPVAIWDGAMELAAKVAETTEDLAKIIKAGIEHIKESDWYKNLDKNEQKITEQNFSDISKKLMNGEDVNFKNLISDDIVELEGWSGISQARMKEIEGVRKIYEREKGTTWTQIQQDALEQLARKYPNKTIYEAARIEVEALAEKYDNKEDYNPTAKDLAVIQEFKRQTEKQINDLQEDLNADIDLKENLKEDLKKESEEDIDLQEKLNANADLRRNLAVIKIEALENDLVQVGKALFKREAGTAFGFRASESKMDENYGLQIRKAKLIRANDGEPLSEADSKFLEDQWAKEKELMKKEQQIREQGLKDAFDAQLEKVKKDYEEKMKAMKAKTTPAVRKQALQKTGKDVADVIRRLKLRGVKLDFTLGTWNLAVEGVAKIVEAGFTVAEAIEQLIQNKTIGFKTAEDRKIFEDNLASFINNLDRRETSLEDIKKMAQANGDTTVTIDMVKKGLIKDFINSHVGEFENKDILEEAYQELKKILPDLDRNTLRRAMLKLDEFKTPDKKTMENMLAQETRALQRLLKKEENKKVKGNEQQKRLLDKEKKSIQRKIREFQRKLKEGEFEKEEPVTLKKQDAELIQLNKEKKEAESAFRKKQQELEEKNKHWLQRFGDTVRNTWVAFLIGSPVTLAKVGYMSLVRPSSEIIRKAVFGKLFNLIYPNISKAAERGGESSGLRPIAEGLKAYFRQSTAESIEKKSQQAIQKYDQSAKAYYDALNTGADAKTLKRLEKQMNRDLENSLSNIIYQFIGGSSLKDSWQSFVNRSNEIEKQFGKVDIESIRDGNALDKMNYIMGFIGRSHSAAKTFSGRFSFAVSFMSRLEGAIKDGSISDPNRVIEIAHESYLDWERGKYQQDNWLTNNWNKIVAAIRKGDPKKPEWKAYNKALEFLTKSEVAITRVPVNVLWEQVGEYFLGSLRAPILAYKAKYSGFYKSKAKAQARMEGFDKSINSAEFKKRVNEIVSTMDQDQAAKIFRLFTKGGLGLGLYGLTLVTGLMHFGVFPHKGQKKKKEEYELEPEELNPGQVMFGNDKLGENASKLIEHTPALWPSFMGLGLAKIYADDVKAGKMTSQAAWDAVYTHLQIIEGGIPQTKVFSPLNVIKGVGKTWAGKASSYGMFDSLIDAKGNFIDKEKEGLKLTSPEVMRLQRYNVAPPELGTRKQYKIEIDKTHPREGLTPKGKEYALMNPHEFTKFTEYRKSYINETLRELYRAEDGAYIGVDKDFRPDYVYLKPNRTIYNLMQNLANKPADGATIELNKQVLAEIMPIIISQSSIVAKNKLIEEGLLPESNYEDEEGNENIMTIKEIIQDLYENNMP